MYHIWSQTLRNQHLSGYLFEADAAGAPNGSDCDSGAAFSSAPVRPTQLCWLHGNSFNSLAYAPLFEALLQPAERHSTAHAGPSLSVFSTDLPGHGRSSAAPERWPDWRAMAAGVEQAMQHQLSPGESDCRRLGIGHSLGGVLTLLQAHQNRHRFEKILLLDPVIFTPAMVVGQQALQTLGLWPQTPLAKSALRRRNRWDSTVAMRQQLASKGFYRRWHPQALAGFVEGGHRPLGTGYQTGSEAAVELSCTPQWEARIFASYPKLLTQALQQVLIPVQIICAQQSMPFILKGAKRAAALNSNISYRIWGQGHCFPMEQPEQTAELIRQWIVTDA